MKRSAILFGLVVTLILTAPVVASPAYFLVSGYTSHNVVKYDAATGAYLGALVTGGSGGLVCPEGLAIGPDGNLYVASAGTHSVKRYDLQTGAYLGTFASGHGMQYPRGVAFGPDGNLYVASSSDVILRYDGDTGAFIDDFVPYGTTNLNDPQDLDFRGDGYLYISNGQTRCVMRVNALTGAYVDTFAAGSPTDSLQGLVFGSDDHLYVADADNNRVRRFDGQSGAFMDDFVPPGYGGLNHAEDVLFGLDGNLYVTSHYTDSILKYDSATGGHLGSFTTTGLDAPTYMLLVPEPGSLALLVLAGLLGARRR